MKKLIRRTLAMTLALLLCCVLPAATAETTQTAAEAAVEKLIPVLGTPIDLPSNQVENNDMDTVNSRTVIAKGGSSFGSDLVAMIRVSPTNVKYWKLELTEENFDNALLCLEADAPSNILAIYEGDEVSDMAISFTGGTDSFTYEGMQEGVRRIRTTLFGSAQSGSAKGSDTPESGSAGAGPYDSHSLFAEFPGIRWGQSRADFVQMFGANTFLTNTDPEEGSDSSSMSALKSVNGSSYIYIFMFRDEKLYTIMILVPEEEAGQYITEYTGIYGAPVKTQFIDALIGKMNESPEGDCSSWDDGDAIISVSTGGLGVLYVQKEK